MRRVRGDIWAPGRDLCVRPPTRDGCSVRRRGVDQVGRPVHGVDVLRDPTSDTFSGSWAGECPGRIVSAIARRRLPLTLPFRSPRSRAATAPGASYYDAVRITVASAFVGVGRLRGAKDEPPDSCVKRT